MQSFNLDPRECLIIEDNENGIKAAQASGGHLMFVRDVSETNFVNITERIREINDSVDKKGLS